MNFKIERGEKYIEVCSYCGYKWEESTASIELFHMEDQGGWNHSECPGEEIRNRKIV